MFANIFEERNKKITHLVKLGDCIGRSIRENVSLFSVDSNTSEVAYLTKSGKVISGNFLIDENISLKNIKIQDSSIFNDEKKFDEYVNGKIHSFVESIHYNEFASADMSFDDVLSLWENRLKIASVQKKLNEQSLKLSKIEAIVESSEFKNLLEITPQLQKFLKENVNKIVKVPEVRNAVNLSNTVSKAFNLPKLTLEELEANKEYVLQNGLNPSIYEMICRQELVKKELVESKKNFDMIWANNSTIRKLASLIFEKDEIIVEGLSAALKEIPYLALVSKKTLFDTFNNCLSQADGIGVSEGDIQEYASKIFEFKKEVKDIFINTINEKYGVDIQNLQDPASFKSLANTQVVIFEALSRLAPKNSVLKSTLSEMAQFLKGKAGVECIDINDYLMETFVEAGYNKLLSEAEDLPKVNFKRVAKDLIDIQDLIMTLKQKAMDQEYPSDEALAPEEEAPPQPPMQQPAATNEMPLAPEDEMPELAPQRSQEEIVNDLTELEKVVGELASELGVDQEETPEEDVTGLDRDGDSQHTMKDHELEKQTPPVKSKNKKIKGKKPLPTEVEEE
jgi:hypothetical protein